MTTTTAPEPPADQIVRLADGYLVSQLLRVAAELGVADALAEGPRTSAELATAVGADADVLHRVLRRLACLGVFDEQPDGRFAPTPAGELLRADVSGSLRAAVVSRASLYYEAAGGLIAAARRGGIPYQHVHGTAFFDHLAGRPGDLAAFQASMTERSAREVPAVLGAYDFSRFGSLVDVGGGRGTLLTAILDATPGLSGLLFDRPEVIDGVSLPAAGGDFFVEVPAGADAYLLSRVVHDWSDEAAGTILRACRTAMPADGTLLLVETVLPDHAADQPNVVHLDLLMLVLVGGRERTVTEFAALLDGAGLRLTDVIPADPETGLHVLEARPAAAAP